MLVAAQRYIIEYLKLFLRSVELMMNKDMSVLKVQSNVRNALSLQQLDVVFGEYIRMVTFFLLLTHKQEAISALLPLILHSKSS